MNSATQVQIPDEAVCILLCAYAHEEAINPTILPSYRSVVEQIGLFSLCMATCKGEGKLNSYDLYTT